MADTRLSFEGQGSLWIGSASVTPGTCTTGTTTIVTIADTNAKVGDVISCSPQAACVSGGAFGAAYCAVAGTISVPFLNPTSGSITQSAITLSYKILRAANS